MNPSMRRDDDETSSYASSAFVPLEESHRVPHRAKKNTVVARRKNHNRTGNRRPYSNRRSSHDDDKTERFRDEFSDDDDDDDSTVSGDHDESSHKHVRRSQPPQTMAPTMTRSSSFVSDNSTVPPRRVPNAVSQDYSSGDNGYSFDDSTYYMAEDENKQRIYGENKEDEGDSHHQECAVMSYGFSLVQISIMGLLMWHCGMAPMKINPMLGPFPDALSEWGGTNAALIVDDGEWWRILTPIFLHAGLFHLIGNLVVQVVAGAAFEKEWGSFRWLIIYLGSAVSSSVLSVICMPENVSVCSSGSVMGLLGAKLAELILRCCEPLDTLAKMKHAHTRGLQCMIVPCSIVVVMTFSFIPFVAWAAQIGGLMGGLIIGTTMFALKLEYPSCQCVWFILGLVVSMVFYFVIIWFMFYGDVAINENLRDACGYYKARYEDYECTCSF